MAKPTLKHIPLDQLTVSKLNMRHGRKRPDVSDILPSIRASGVRQTLLVRPEGKGYGVIAGRRRFFALKAIAKETGKIPLVPCAIMKESDAASAIEASIIENVARLPATEMEQYTAFKRLHDKGRNVDDIASYFGVTELKVRRVLSLASLSEPIRTLYAADIIDRETIRALTLATPEQQAEWLRLCESEDEHAPRGRACKAWITGGNVITTDKALFDLAVYEGAVTADLFGEAAVFADADTFWAAQSKAVSGRVEAYLADGWRDVTCLERGAYFYKWDHETRAREEGGKVFVEIRHDGLVAFHEGYVTRAEAKRLDRAAKGETGETPKTIKPEMSGPLAEYISLHRHGAARASLLGAPAIALRLMVAHAMTGSDNWSTRPHTLSTRKEETEKSITASTGEADFATAETEILKLFAALGVNGSARRNGDGYRLCELFAALLAMSDAEVLQVLAFTMADTLEPGGPVVEAVLHVCETDLSTYWRPDAAFFDLMRDKRAINAMVADIATQSLAETSAKETAKVQKEIIANRIKGEGCEVQPDWRPGWMQVPPTRLVEGAASVPADAWSRVAGLFAQDETGDGQPENLGETASAA